MSTFTLELPLTRHLHAYNDNSVNSSNWKTAPTFHGNSLGSINMNNNTRSYICSVAYSGSAQNFPTLPDPNLYKIVSIKAKLGLGPGASGHSVNSNGAVMPMRYETDCVFGLYTTLPGAKCGAAIATSNTVTLNLNTDMSEGIALIGDSTTLINTLNNKPSLLCVIITANLIDVSENGAAMLTPGATLTLEIEYKTIYDPIPSPTWNLNLDKYSYNNQYYVSAQSFSLMGKNKISLTWIEPDIINFENPDLFQYYTLYALINNAETYTITKLNYGTGYDIDFSNLRDINDNLIELSPGNRITFQISSYGEKGKESPKNSTVPFYINYPPTAPSINNAVMSSSMSEGVINYKLGTDSLNNMPVSFIWSHILPEDWTDPVNDWPYKTDININVNDANYANCYGYTYDGWDLSLPQPFKIIKNEVPILDFDITFNNTNNEFTIDNITITNSTEYKILSNIRYYVRAANDIESVKNMVTYNEFSYTDNSYSFNPFDKKSYVYPGQYYQIGIKISDGIEDSELTWSDKIVQIYGGIEILNNNTPIISHTDNIISLTPDKYKDWYRNRTINVNCTLPDIPSGLEKLYYQFAYSDKSKNSEWINISSRKEYDQNSKIINDNITFEYDISKLCVRINIYNAELNETQVVYSPESNALNFAPRLTWEGINNLFTAVPVDTAAGDMNQDKRFSVRPTLYSQLTEEDAAKQNAFTLTIPIPHTPPYLNYPSDISELMYLPIITNGKEEIYLTNDSDLYIPVSITDATGSLEGGYSIITSFSHQFLKDLGVYNLCTALRQDLTLKVRFKDPFGDIKESLTTNLSFDFREKPLKATEVLLGRDGLYNPEQQNYDFNQIILPYEFIFPSNDTNNKVILNEESILISFNQSKSYDAQEINKYYIYLYKKGNNTNTLIKTYSISASDSLIFTKDNGTKITLYRIFLGNIFQDTSSEYFITVSGQDADGYLGNIGEESEPSNSLFGSNRIKPNINLGGTSFVFENSVINYEIPQISFEIDNKTNYLEFLWPADDGTIYNRGVTCQFKNNNNELISIKYTPNCTYSIEYSFSPTFEDYASINLGTATVDYRLTDDLFTGTKGTIDNSSVTTVYVRGKAVYRTGLEYIDGIVQINEQVTYSSIVIFSGATPTVSYRKNAVGINTIPTSEEVFAITEFSTSKIINLRGLQNAEYVRKLMIDLSTGQITGQWETPGSPATNAFQIAQELLPFTISIWDEGKKSDFYYSNLTST